MLVRSDCRYFLGDRPCAWGGVCEGCEHYAPRGRHVVVVKLAAAGDVLRTTSILAPLKRAMPDSFVTWVTDEAALPLVALNPYVDTAAVFGFDSWLTLKAQSLDLLICLDKEERACAFCSSLDAGEKRGFGLSEGGWVEPLNEGARYDYELGLSDEMKFRVNELTYPEIFCRTAGLPYEGDAYELALPEASLEYADRFLGELPLAEPLVGLNVGAGRVFANKAWTTDGFAELARAVHDRLGGTALVLGGPDDRERAEDLLAAAPGATVDGGLHELIDFAAIVAHLDAIVTGDTLAMHLAIALGVPTVAIFGPSAPQEVELYGRGARVVTPLDCAPCYRRACSVSPTCMDKIDAETVLAALEDVVDT
jgi:ADP-heptose:LPS heptosyltransferase